MGRRQIDEDSQDEELKMGFIKPDPPSSEEEMTRRKCKRTFAQMEDEERNTDFDIMEFTTKKRQVGSNILYTVLTHDCREHEATLQELDFVANKDSETLDKFVIWLGGKNEYKKLFEKNVQKLAAEPLPAKRQRKDPAPQDVNSYSDEDLKIKPQKQTLSKKDLLNNQPKLKIEVPIVPGNLDDHIPFRVRSLHNTKWSKEFPETTCTVEWKRDVEKGYVPGDSRVTYAEMRKQYPLLLCEFFESRTRFI